MSVYNHYRPRIAELLDAVRNEFEQLTQEALLCKSQRDDLEYKMNSQVQEMALFQQNLVELERMQMHMKKQYEDEIARLRQQLDQIQHPYSGDSKHPLAAAPPGGGESATHRPPPPPHTYPTSSPKPPPPMQSAPPLSAAPPPAAVPPPPVATPSLNDIDPESVPSSYKNEGQDWFALFNPRLPRHLQVGLVHTFEHNSVVCCVKFSADGQYLAAGCNQTTYIYEVATGAQRAVLQDEGANRKEDLYIRSVSFSPDGKYIATGAEDKLIRIWDIEKKRIRHVLRGHEQDIYSLEFSRDGRILVSGSGDRTVRVWDWAADTPVHVLRIKDPEEKDFGVTSVAISPDGRVVAAGSLDKVVRVWDAHTGHELERLEGHKDSVYSVAFMPDGRSLVSGSLDKTLRLWQLGSGSKGGACKQVFSGHKDFVLSVATTYDGHWIVSGSKDRGVQFWDPRTGQTLFMLQGHKNSVISVATSPGKKPLFATGSGDHRARIWTFERI